MQTVYYAPPNASGISFLSEIDTVLFEIDAILSEVDALVSEIDAVFSKINAILSEVDAVVSEIDAVVPEVNTTLRLHLFLPRKQINGDYHVVHESVAKVKARITHAAACRVFAA